jgi:hypothetical protein
MISCGLPGSGARFGAIAGVRVALDNVVFVRYIGLAAAERQVESDPTTWCSSVAESLKRKA